MTPSRRSFVLPALAGLLLGTTAMTADITSVPADQALAAALAGTTVFVDIRTPEEWAATGVPQGATAIMMQDPDFVQKVTDALGGDKSRSLTLICRSGNRTHHTAAALGRMGFSAVAHVGEGMIGGPYGPGWIARGLPVTRPD